MTKLNYYRHQDAGIVLTPEEYEQLHGWTQRTDFQRYFQGSFQPYIDAYKDIKDTFKPYKGRYQIRNDFFQPIYGIGNLLQSAYFSFISGFLIICSPIALLIAGSMLTYNCFFTQSPKEPNQKLADNALNYWPIQK